MNRRMFLAMPATSGIAAAAAAAIGRSELVALRTQLRKDLFDDYLPFHDKFVNDKQYGGFHCTVRPNGELVSADKRAWFEGRGTWVYSFLYNNFSKEQKYLDLAAGSLKLVAKTKPEGDEFWPRALNRDGTASGPADTELYGDMFIAEGMAEFAKASGDRRYWDDAKQIVLKCVRRYDSPNYHPSIGKTYLGPDAPPLPGARIQGVAMVMIRALSQMLAQRPDAELQKVLDGSIDAVLKRHLNPRYNLIAELVNHDYSMPTNLYGQLVYAGHAIETLWMILYEARRRKDRALYDRVAELFKRHCEVSKDRVYGGLFRNLTNVDQNAWTTDKTLFPHQEALIGALLLVEDRNDDWALDFFREINTYTRAKFPMRAIQSPLWQVIGNRQVDLTPDMTRAENYHHPRFLMMNLLSVENLLKAPGPEAR